MAPQGLKTAKQTSAARGGGASYYSDELKELLRLLKALPDTIPIGTEHDFINFEPDPEKVVDFGDERAAVNQAVEVSFGARTLPGKDEMIPVVFKTRGPALEAIVEVFRQYITGSGGSNVIMCKWVDDLRSSAKKAILDANQTLPRAIHTTAAKRLLEEEENTTNSAKRKKKDLAAVKGQSKKDLAAAKEKTEQGKIPWDFDDLEDDVVEPKLAKRGRGAPTNKLLDRLVIPCHSITDKTKKRFRCMGDRCKWSCSAPRMSGRILPHASECAYFPEETREDALMENAEDALGAQVVLDEDDEDNNEKEPGKDAFAAFVKTGQDERVVKTNLLALELWCSAGLALRLFDAPRFRKFMNHLDPKNKIYVSTTFSENKIPAEAARITVLVNRLLRKQQNLTISYDGATIKKGESIYTFHVTTPDTRISYFVHGDVASGLSHTGDHIKAAALKVMDRIGRSNFSAVSCDSTGNTRLSRDLLVDEIPTLTQAPDPCHHASNLIKNICAIEYFVMPILKIRDIVSHFSQSTQASTHLDGMRVSLGLNHGLQKIGKTRFGTVFWATSALDPLLPPIHMLVQTGVVATNSQNKHGRNLSWMKNLREYTEFQLHVKQLLAVLEPIARTIKCLEGTQVTTGDIWMFFVAITAVLDDLFTSNELGIPDNTMDEIRGHVNNRFEQLIEGPDGGVYLAGFYLNPDRVDSPILRETTANRLARSATATPMSTGSSTDKDLRDSIPAYGTVGAYLYSLLQREIKAERNPPQFSGYKKSADVLGAFRAQFEAYTRQHAPFSARSSAWTKPYLYWMAMSDRPDAGILAYLAIKVLSILPNSMAEERTVSNFTKLNTNDRANQSAKTIIAMTKIQQHLHREDERNSPDDSAKHPPVLRWRVVKKLMPFKTGQSAEAPAKETDSEINQDGPLSEECMAGLQCLEKDSPGECDKSSHAATFCGIESTSVNFRHAFFRDLLSDEPVIGADEIKSLGETDLGSQNTVGKGKVKLIIDDLMDEDEF
ncbi:unnamed protein product [Mycena citricolor]|uniref:DUF659 domain-containing protein n=1 Tax=Mycena citricolor TaxID=2018698 RepID=A0AAD2HFC8_9AGAR|nr:unnamed protein product [Mycena citricolor]